MNKFIIIFFLVSSNLVTCQELFNVVNQIEREKRLFYKSIDGNYSVTDSNDFLNLKNQASEEQLIQLTKHKNGKVKTLAFLILANKQYDKLFSIILEQIKDTTTVRIQMGCVAIEKYTTDYFIDVVSEGKFKNNNFKKLTIQQKNIISNLLIADDKSKLSARTNAIFALKATMENYDLIRSLVSIEKNYAAIYTLATFKNENDKKIIASCFNEKITKYEAARSTFIFHDDYFYPYLKKACEKLIKNYLVDEHGYSLLFKALANYPKQETLSFFEKIIKERDYNEYRNEKIAKYVLIAIAEYPNPKYNLLKNKIKVSDKTLKEINDELAKKQLKLPL